MGVIMLPEASLTFLSLVFIEKTSSGARSNIVEKVLFRV
jgi:hypothetical protein